MRTRLLGLALSLVGIVAVLWLAFTGGLSLYIHPRYFGFTITMAILAAVMIVAAIVYLLRGRGGGAGDGDDAPGHGPGAARRGRRHAGARKGTTRARTAGGHAHGSRGASASGTALLERDDDHDHDHDSEPDETRGARTWHVASGIALVLVATVVLLVLPPTTLTTSLIDKRDMNAAAAAAQSDEVQLAGADTSQFTVRDWAGLLRQGADATSLSGMTPTLVGFVTPDPDDPEDTFFVARFTVTCCAVDAQPVGVPVHLPGWEQRFPVDSWVEVTGPFITNPSARSMQTVVVDPVSIAPTEQPAQPYVT